MGEGIEGWVHLVHVLLGVLSGQVLSRGCGGVHPVQVLSEGRGGNPNQVTHYLPSPRFGLRRGGGEG